MIAQFANVRLDYEPRTYRAHVHFCINRAGDWRRDAGKPANPYSTEHKANSRRMIARARRWRRYLAEQVTP